MRRLRRLLPLFALIAVPPAGGAATLDAAPTVPQPSRPGDIVGIDLQNAGAAAEPAGYVTFGELFKIGAVRPGEALVARIGRTLRPLQMDVKATNPDGSVRHAILTFHAPAIPAGASVGVMLAKGRVRLPPKAAPSITELLASGYDLATSLNFTGLTPKTHTASAAAALRAAGSRLWLTGPLVREYIAKTTVADGLLKVEFDIAAYADGTTKTDVIYDNSWFRAGGKKDLAYSVTISQAGKPAYSYGHVNQWLYSLWHHEVDSAGVVHPNVQYDVPYLEATGAILHYDTGLGGVADATIRDFHLCNTASNASPTTYQGSTNPMGASCLATYFASAGGRREGDWGPQPEWVVNWLLSQNALARTDMMENADAAGGIPWHYTDEDTGAPIDPDKFPSFPYAGMAPASGWPLGNHGSAPAANGDPWNPDTAHMADLNYIPYLITGSHYQLQLFDAQGVWSIFRVFSRGERDPSGAAPFGISAAVNGNETRAMAYELRQVAEAAFIDPDADGLKPMFRDELKIGMAGYLAQYVAADVNRKNGEIDGFIAGYTGPNYGEIVTFEEDVMVDSFALVAGMQLPAVSAQAVRMMQYMDNYTAGRFVNGANGFSPYYGASYWARIYDAAEAPFATWYLYAAGNGAYGLWTPTSGRPARIAATLQAADAGSLETRAGVFSFGAPTKSGERVVTIRVGRKPPFRFAAGSELAAGADGGVYLRNKAGRWFVFTATGRYAQFRDGPDPKSFLWNKNINGSGVNDGYSFIAQTALANLLTYVNSPRDKRAYDWLARANDADFGGRAGVVAAFQADPQWAIVPARR
jgi:hypothetical protein